jgi:hypothetical protein
VAAAARQRMGGAPSLTSKAVTPFSAEPGQLRFTSQSCSGPTGLSNAQNCSPPFSGSFDLWSELQSSSSAGVFDAVRPGT